LPRNPAVTGIQEARSKSSDKHAAMAGWPMRQARESSDSTWRCRATQLRDNQECAQAHQGVAHDGKEGGGDPASG